MRYSIDTSALLDGWHRYYRPKVFPGLWENLEALVADGKLRASEEVYLELQRKDDAAFAWAKKHRGMFVKHDAAILSVVSAVLKDHRALIRANGNRSGADPFVIALAKTHGCVVITGERLSDSPKKPRIPNVCQALGIQWTNVIGVCEREGWTFVPSR
jgi:hypothetical protein